MERYKQECKKINEQINPSDEFIQNLKSNLNKKVTEEKMKRKYFLSKVAVVFCTISVISSGVFAKDIGNWLAKIFANTDEAVQVAVENGYVQNVDMDYIENDGVAIKVNSLIIDNNKMNILFDVKGEIDGTLGIKDLELKINETEYNNKIITNKDILYNQSFKSIDKKNHYFIIDISNLENSFKISDCVEINLSDLIIIKKENEVEDINGMWNFEIRVEEDNFKTKVASFEDKYIIEDNVYVEDYKITVNNTGTNIQLTFKENFNKYYLMKNENIYIEFSNGEKCYCRDFRKIENNKVKINLPMTSFDNVEDFKIIFNSENEEICLNVKKENS